MKALAEAISEIARAAGVKILAIRERGAAVREKADRSPVTDADEAANALIVARLGAQSEFVQKAFENRMPSFARRSMLGVCSSGWPAQLI